MKKSPTQNLAKSIMLCDGLEHYSTVEYLFSRGKKKERSYRPQEKISAENKPKNEKRILKNYSDIGYHGIAIKVYLAQKKSAYPIVPDISEKSEKNFEIAFSYNIINSSPQC